MSLPTSDGTRFGYLGLKWTSIHQCPSWGWGHSSRFGDESKTHPPLPKAFGFFSLFFAPKFFPLTYLPPTYSYLPSPLLLTSPHFELTPSSEALEAGPGERLKQEPGQLAWNRTQNNALCPICCTLSGSTGPGTYLFRKLHNWIRTFVVARKSDAWLGPSSFCYKHAQTFLWWQVLLHLPQNLPTLFVCRVQDPDVSATTTQHSST